MRSIWLKQHGQHTCLVFMAGWGMGPEPFAGLIPEGCDCLFCWDYRQLTPPPFPSGYKRVVLLAWSMGVWAAAHLLADWPLSGAVAVAGTLQPVDDRRGIPEAALTEILLGMDGPAQERFYCSMFEEEREAQRFLDNRPHRSPASLQDELYALVAAIRTAGPAADIYTRRLVTTRDRIFPATNQLRAWGRGAEKLRRPHFPFYAPGFFQDLLR